MVTRERRLAAIMFTDMVGYTSLGQRNESLSVALVEQQRKLIRPVVSGHQGREIKTVGDAFLIEFSSALDAVRCAYDIQRVLREYNFSQSDERKLHVRIGVHLGDVIESDDGDISGDAVNIASRIEPLAEEAGVCVSQQVYDQVWNKFELTLQNLGPKTLKNVSMPIQVYRLQLPWNSPEKTSNKSELDRKRVAVLPFTNMSPDPNDTYLADGVTEEIISTLSSISELSIISRTSIMGYKGTTKKAREIGEELGVGSILEGSFRKAGNRIRITAQLVDARNDRHVWAESYDRQLDDVFAVQSEIAEKVAETLRVKLLAVEKHQLLKSPTENTEAYSSYLKGRSLLTDGSDISVARALEAFQGAIRLDPGFARAYAGAGECYAEFGYRSIVTYNESIAQIKAAAKKALEIDPILAEAHYLLALAAWFEDIPHLDEAEATRAIELNPNLAEAQELLGLLKSGKGYPLSGIKLMEGAYSLNPRDSRTVQTLGRMFAYLGWEKEFSEFVAKSSNLTPLATSIVKAEYYYTKGDYDAAEKEIAWQEERYPEDFRVISGRGRLSALRGDRVAAENSLQKLKEKFSGGATLLRHLGIIHFYLGDVDAGFAEMKQAASEHVLEPLILRYSPLFEKARKDPRYVEVMVRANLNAELKEIP